MPPAPEQPVGRIKASPLARKIADEKNVDLTSIKGTGPGGRIVEKDVEAAAVGRRETFENENCRAADQCGRIGAHQPHGDAQNYRRAPG